MTNAGASNATRRTANKQSHTHHVNKSTSWPQAKACVSAWLTLNFEG